MALESTLESCFNLWNALYLTNIPTRSHMIPIDSRYGLILARVNSQSISNLFQWMNNIWRWKGHVNRRDSNGKVSNISILLYNTKTYVLSYHFFLRVSNALSIMKGIYFYLYLSYFWWLLDYIRFLLWDIWEAICEWISYICDIFISHQINYQVVYEMYYEIIEDSLTCFISF